MPEPLVKPHPDKDFYCFWSTISDSVTWWGNAKDLCLDDEPDRKERADKFGSSIFGGRLFGWNDEVIPVVDMGTDTHCYLLPRENLYDFLLFLDEKAKEAGIQIVTAEMEQEALDKYAQIDPEWEQDNDNL